MPIKHYLAIMKQQTTAAKLNLELKRLEVEEKRKELENVDKRLTNATKGIVVEQVNTLMRLLETATLVTSQLGETKYEPSFDEEDQLKIKAKIMRLINTF
jgi:hypothetical protein